jgi:hypothetical protein
VQAPVELTVDALAASENTTPTLTGTTTVGNTVTVTVNGNTYNATVD